MHHWLAYGVARFILSLRIVDKAYRAFDHLRSELILAFVTDAVLDRFNDLAFGTIREYRPDSPSFRSYLMPWEEAALDRFFPPPPARILIGGAGGGREPFALAARGYEVVAFEPSRLLAETMAVSIPAGMRMQAYRAGYEDLPQLFPATPGGAAASLDDLGQFDGAIFGWESFPHLRTEQHRTLALRTFAKVTKGPILVSFYSRKDAPEAGARRWIRRFLRGRFNQVPGNSFSLYLGFYHRITKAELEALADFAELTLVHLSTDERETNWPHAVLCSYLTGMDRYREVEDGRFASLPPVPTTSINNS